MDNVRPLAVAILAAGKGKRMGNPDKAKVLAVLNNKPLLGYVLETAQSLAPEKIVVIVGFQRQAVIDFVGASVQGATCKVQEQQLGTGHAVLQTASELADIDADVLILSGDVPLITTNTLASFVEHHRNNNATLSVLSTLVDDPTGYGRIVRDSEGAFTRIVEQKDASPEEQAINEINSGVYVVHSQELFSALERVGNSNAQHEFYLTDIVSILLADGKKVEAFVANDAEELHGINTVQDLERAVQILAVRSNVTA